ncbi:MAG: transcriptional repressor [Holophagales bacterium]|jgi:Fur family ferric uptake transcriptional regulator|nr:transcriptional repressor [Holophagales bacterium]
MSRPPVTPSLPVAPTKGAGPLSRLEAARLREELRGKGLKVTAPRVAVLWALRGSKSPISHGEMADRFEEAGWDRATVYRNLLDLVKAGLARRIDVGDHTWRFETVAGDAGSPEHPHFLCNECGAVECLADVTLAGKGRDKGPKALRREHVEILLRGLCDRCI